MLWFPRFTHLTRALGEFQKCLSKTAIHKISARPDLVCLGVVQTFSFLANYHLRHG